jgi:hypothetical protein
MSNSGGAGHGRITYSPVGSGEELVFPGLGHASVRSALVGVWGAFPIRLSAAKGHCGILRAMGCAVGKDCALAYVILADRLEQWGEMELRDG